MREDVIYRTKILEENQNLLKNRIEFRRTDQDDRRSPESLESKIRSIGQTGRSEKSDLARGKEPAEIKTSSTGAASLYKMPTSFSEGRP